MLNISLKPMLTLYNTNRDNMPIKIAALLLVNPMIKIENMSEIAKIKKNKSNSLDMERFFKKNTFKVIKSIARKSKGFPTPGIYKSHKHTESSKNR